MSCTSCQKPAIQRCIRCKQDYYCSRKCQQENFACHKLKCKLALKCSLERTLTAKKATKPIPCHSSVYNHLLGEILNQNFPKEYHGQLVTWIMMPWDNLTLPVRAKLGESPGKGLGLFATEDLQAGAFISLYSFSHAIWRPVRENSDGGVYMLPIITGEPWSFDAETALKYAQTFSTDGVNVLEVVGNPNRKVPGQLAHFANDAVASEAVAAKGPQLLEAYNVSMPNAFLVWTDLNLVTANLTVPAIFDRPLNLVCAAYARKKIKEGDEVTVSYGVSYFDSTISESFDIPAAVADLERRFYHCRV